jgi:hypothetical protein
MYCQYVEGLHIHDFELEWGEGLPSYFSNGMECENFRDLEIDGFSGRQARASSPDALIALKQGQGVSIRNSTATEGTGTFLALSGVRQERLFVNNDLGAAKRAMLPANLDFKFSGNLLPH